MTMRIKTRTILCAVLISFLPALGVSQRAAAPEAPLESRQFAEPERLLAPGLGRHPETLLVSVNRARTRSGNDYSGFSVISANGRFVAFASVASDLVANDTNGTENIFVRDLRTGTTALVSVNSAGTDTGDMSSFNPVISADGRFVAFESDAGDLVANDTNGTADAFVRD